MKSRFPISLLIICCLLPLSMALRNEPQQLPQASIRKLGTDALALSVFQHIARRTEGNVAYSPASLEDVLLLLKKGASGTTAAELQQLAYGQQGVRTAMSPHCATALFLDERLKLKPGVFDGEVQHAPLSTNANRAVSQIHHWCARQTKGSISSIVSPGDFDENSRLVAVSAVALDEAWQAAFTKDKTCPAPFTLTNGRKQEVSMMHLNLWCPYAEGRGWKAVALPYKVTQNGEPGYFIGILPQGNVREFVKNLTPETLKKIRLALREDVRKYTTVRLPAFSVQPQDIDFRPILQDLGVSRMFSPKAEFDGFIANSQPLKVSKLVQKCKVRVHEQGTKAEAVTVSVMPLACSAPAPPPRPTRSITFDHPFIWLISDLSSAAPPWFMGVYEGN